MNKSLLMLICCQLLLSACSNPSGQSSSKGPIVTSEVTGIIGGEKVESDSNLSKMVVLVDSVKRSTIGFIRNGQEVFPLEHFTCTGVFISENIVLTAAHCITEAPFKMRIIYSNDLSNKSAQISEVEETIIHNGYNKEAAKSTNDIALIKIKGERPADYVVSAITAMPATQKAFSMLSIGYGVSNNKLQDGGKLHQVTTTGMSYDPLSPRFEIDQSNGKGICQGDSGGPGFIIKDGEYAVLGVAGSVYSSLKDGDQFACQHFGVYTNVLFYADWILKNIQQLNGTVDAQ